MFITNSFNYLSPDFICFDSIKNHISLNLTPFQQKIAAFAILLLSSTAAIYAYYHCFKARKIEEEDDNDIDLNFDKLKKNQVELNSKKGGSKSSTQSKAPIGVDAQPSPEALKKLQGKHADASSTLISQVDYLDYKHALADIRVVCQCDKKGELNRLEESQGRLQKRVNDTGAKVISRVNWQTAVASEDYLKLRKKIKVINDIHAKLHGGQSEPTFGEYVLAADEYNANLKVMQAWNQAWKGGIAKSEFFIVSPLDPKVTDLQPMKVAKPLSEDEKALKSYFELLRKYPQLKRMGDNNDHKKGIYEIVYDEDKIREIQSLDYKKFYNKFGSHELAAQASRPGLVYEDAFWLILRDCVITPKGVKLTYHRLIQKSELNQCVGAAVMPIITLPNGETKISLILHYRHATQSWEFELPRGSSEPGETPEQTARRELREETGYEVEGPLHLGTFPPNSGALSSLVPVFSGRVTIDRGEEEIDEEEAIKGKFLFTFDEIMQALKSPDSCLEVIIDGEKKRYPVRDPFLYCALLLSDL